MREQLITVLTNLPDQICRAEEAALLRSEEKANKKNELQETEDTLVLGDMLDAKNADGRAAQLRQKTEHHRRFVTVGEKEHARAMIQLRALQNQLAAAKAIAYMLGAPASTRDDE